MRPWGFLGCCAVSLLTASCSPQENWTATRQTPVYASDDDDEEKILFFVHAGEVCTPLRERVNKVYLHTEVRCRAGQGWVTDQEHFKVTPAGPAAEG